MRDRRNCDLCVDCDFKSLRAQRCRGQSRYVASRMSVSSQAGEATREFFESAVLQILRAVFPAVAKDWAPRQY